MSTDTVDQSTAPYKPSDSEAAASGGGGVRRVKVDAKEGLMGVFDKKDLKESVKNFCGLLQEFTVIPAYVVDKDSGNPTDENPDDWDDLSGNRTTEPSDAQRAYAKKYKLVKERWIGRFLMNDDTKSDLVISTGTWFFRSFAEALLLWDRVSYLGFSLWIGDQPNSKGGKIVKPNLKEFHGPGDTKILKVAQTEVASHQMALEILQDELKDFYKVFVPKGERAANGVMPWAALDQFLRLEGFEEFTNQPDYVALIKRNPDFEEFDASTWKDWAAIQGWFTKHKAKLPVSLKTKPGTSVGEDVDPFADE